MSFSKTRSRESNLAHHWSIRTTILSNDKADARRMTDNNAFARAPIEQKDHLLAQKKNKTYVVILFKKGDPTSTNNKEKRRIRGRLYKWQKVPHLLGREWVETKKKNGGKRTHNGRDKNSLQNKLKPYVLLINCRAEWKLWDKCIFWIRI